MSHSESPPLKYAAFTRFLHWVVAILVLATIPIGVVMLTEGLPRARQDLLFILHKNGGVIILLLVLMRIFWRVLRPAPRLPAELPRWQVLAAGVVQWALYGMLLVMAVSGYIRVTAGGFPIEMLDAIGFPRLVEPSEALAKTAKTVHANARFGLVALIVVHTVAGVQHLIRRDGVFLHIWPPLGGR